MRFSAELGLALALAMVAAIAVAQPSQQGGAGVEVHGPLDAFNMTHCFYRDMNISLTLSMENLLSSASPPPCPSLAPRDGSMTCSCSLLPEKWWLASWSLLLGSGEQWSTTIHTGVPGNVALGQASVGFGCNCSYALHCVTTTTSTATTTSLTCTPYDGGSRCWPITTTTTVNATVTSTSMASTTIAATENITVLPRRVNETLLGLDLNITLLQVLVDYPRPGMSSALVNLTVALYNLGLGLDATLPMEQGMLLLHNLTVLVNGYSVIVCNGYCAPAKRIPVDEPNATLAPSASGSVELILTPPEEPANTYTYNVTVCYTEDTNSTPTCTSYNITVPLPFGWRVAYYVTDTCRLLQEVWEVVLPNETGYRLVVLDTVGPSITAKDQCIVAEAGACEEVGLRVYRGGLPVASRAGWGSVSWCPRRPGVYAATAVDEYNNTAAGVYTLTWTTGPPTTLRQELLGLAGVLLALMVVLYIVFGGGWPLREL